MAKNSILLIVLGFIFKISAYAEIPFHPITMTGNPSISDYDLLHYDFHLNVETGSRSIHGFLKVKAKSLSNNFDAFEFQLHDNFSVDSIVFDGNKIGFERVGAHRKIANLSRAIPRDDIFDIVLYYRGSAPLSTNDWGNGIVQKKDSRYNTEVFYTLSVPYHAYEWFPCKQVLSDLIDSVSMTIITQKENTVVSNGIPVSDTDLQNGKHAVSWKTKYPINYYLISFNIGKYISYHYDVELPGKTDGKMPVMNFLYNQTALNKQKPVLEKIPDFLVNYSGLFGLYPFHKEKFGSIIVPLSGGMEHQTIVNLSTDYDKYLAAHEMAHQWWGNNVNVKSYHDVWLSEGWATYCEYLTAEKLFPTEARSILDKFHNNALTQTAGQTYTTDTTNFSTIYNYSNVYMKGAAIIHTLRAEVNNDSLFFAVLTSYQSAFRQKCVDAEQFKGFLERGTGKNLDLFFNQWYYGFGYPKFTITWANSNDKLIIKSVQTTSSSKTPLFKTNVEFAVRRNNLPDTLIKVYQESNEQVFIIEGMKDVTGITLDPRNIILNKLVSSKNDPTLISTNYPDSLETLISFFPNPAREVLHIETHIQGNWKLELFNTAGIPLLVKYVNERQVSIPLHGFDQSSIVLKISNGQESWSRMVLLDR